ncbi:uncharacterized protein LOC111688314 [Lucilia cuprina]|uniref:uncharacterized protein LOC111688314 n=1 Tax=Lucilia cuprina TaxID=7375 RepID=UPI001F063CBA|nr:uncharacterized protein LOC111688314 [Lucilia cuprina]
MGLIETTIPSRDKITLIVPVFPENTTLPSIEIPEEGSFYILIPLGVLLGIVILALLVCLMASHRRNLVHMYCKKRQARRFLYEDNEYDSPLEQDPDAVEEEEDEVDNEDNPTKSLLRGKLQINNRYENYLSTSHLNRSSDIFT